VIFDAKEFLKADVMLVSLADIRSHRLRLRLRAVGVRHVERATRPALGHGAADEGVTRAGGGRNQSALAQRGLAQ
jgi:hypothetical protein